MAKKSVYSTPGPAQIEFNMTPMIDVTFQLILFFILVGQVASDALAKMIVPKPHASQAQDPEEVQNPNRIIVNIVSASDSEKDLGPKDAKARQVGFYQVGPKNVGKGRKGLDAMEKLITERMATLKPAEKDTFYIEVRADKRLQFSEVFPVLELAGKKGVPLMNITAIRDLPELEEK